MTLPTPRPGLVIRYGFLWSHEADRGADESSKDRPCAIVVAARRSQTGEINTAIAPITHSPPLDPDTSIELPKDVARSLGLDDGRHWLRFDEINEFIWPGFDLRPLPGKSDQYTYGDLPKPLFERFRKAILDRAKRKKLRSINRD